MELTIEQAAVNAAKGNYLDRLRAAGNVMVRQMYRMKKAPAFYGDSKWGRIVGSRNSHGVYRGKWAPRHSHEEYTEMILEARAESFDFWRVGITSPPGSPPISRANSRPKRFAVNIDKNNLTLSAGLVLTEAKALDALARVEQSVKFDRTFRIPIRYGVNGQLVVYKKTKTFTGAPHPWKRLALEAGLKFIISTR